MKRRAVFLDRDGVLNEAVVKSGKPYPPASVGELVVPEDVLPALEALKALGYLLIGATNQPDVARGKTTQKVVEAIHQKLLSLLPLDEIRICYHDDADACHCRKPLPGMLLDAAKMHDIHLQESIMIGDRWRDIEAGQNAGCKTILLDRAYQERRADKEADFITSSLSQAATWIKGKM